MKETHTMEHSPRYVEHHAKPEGSLNASNHCNQPTPPLRPRPPSFGKLTGRGCRQPMSSSKGSETNWPQPGAALKSHTTQQSNSGDWDGIVTDIVLAVEACEVEEEVEEDLDSDERSCEERSWEESEVAAAFAPFHFTAKYDYDSSYDSTSSLNSTHEFEDATMAVIELPTSVWDADAKSREEGAASCREGPTSGVHEVDASSAAEADAATAGLEFSAGVHLIDEMENQVKQWEEHEAMRENAYHSWVARSLVEAHGTGTNVPNGGYGENDVVVGGHRFVKPSSQVQQIKTF